MPVFQRPATVFLLGLMAAAAAAAAAAAEVPHRECLGKAEQRAAVASHQAIPLAQAIKSARKHGHRGELIGARLCRRGERLDYVLTLLPRNGKVTRESVDAANGKLISTH
jgi:uncharacterized membrane protein YkoI